MLAQISSYFVASVMNRSSLEIACDRLAAVRQKSNQRDPPSILFKPFTCTMCTVVLQRGIPFRLRCWSSKTVLILVRASVAPGSKRITTNLGIYSRSSKKEKE